jgi:hypothetical protein
MLHRVAQLSHMLIACAFYEIEGDNVTARVRIITCKMTLSMMLLLLLVLLDSLEP